MTEPMRLYAGALVSGGSGSIALPTRAYTALVVTEIDLVPVAGGSSGDQFLFSTNPALVGFWQGAIGAGVFDTFQWQGWLPLYYADSGLYSTTTGSTNWTCVISGFAVPKFSGWAGITTRP